MAELEEILTHLHAKTPGYVVQIDDAIAHGIGHNDAAATAQAHSRFDALRRGERVAHVIVNGRRTSSMIVTREQVDELLVAGAVWTGPAHYAPARVRLAAEAEELGEYANEIAIEPARSR